MIATNYYDLLRASLPQIIVACTALLVLTVDLLWMQKTAVRTRFHMGVFLAVAGCGAAILLLLFQSPGANTLSGLWDGLLVVNPLTRLVEIAVVGFAILAVLFSVRSIFTVHVGEYLGLILFATVAMMFLVAAQNLLMIFITLELLSLSLYILTAFDKRSRQSAEAALKYFLFGGMSAAFMLFGMSLLYGATGAIGLARIAAAVQPLGLNPLIAVASVMIVIGFGFKIAAAPFHWWAPDAYQGAPTPSAALIASGSKVASLFAFAQVMLIGLGAVKGSGAWHSYSAGWGPVLAIVAALSMIVGNLAAIVQSDLRRLLAYSAIGHAGYMLLGILPGTRQGVSALLYYVVTYALAAIGAFGVLAALEEGTSKIADLAGLSRRAPVLSFCMLIFLLSLAGIPPLAGFFGKFYIFSTLLESQPGWLWLVILPIATSAISLYYYLKVLKQIYVLEDPNERDVVNTSPLIQAVLCLIAGAIILLGCFPELLLGWIGKAFVAGG